MVSACFPSLLGDSLDLVSLIHNRGYWRLEMALLSFKDQPVSPNNESIKSLLYEKVPPEKKWVNPKPYMWWAKP